MTDGRRLLREAYTALRFGIVGILATLTHFGVLAGMLGLGVGPVLSNATAYVLAVAVSFLGHHFWTYRAGGPLLPSFLRFMSASGAAFLVSTLLLVFLIRVVLLPDAVAAFFAAAVVPVITFIAFRIWVFRRRQ